LSLAAPAGRWFRGVLRSYDSATGAHTILYDPSYGDPTPYETYVFAALRHFPAPGDGPDAPRIAAEGAPRAWPHAESLAGRGAGVRSSSGGEAHRPAGPALKKLRTMPPPAPTSSAPDLPPALVSALAALLPPGPDDASPTERRALLRGALLASALPTPAQLPDAAGWSSTGFIRPHKVEDACMLLTMLRVRTEHLRRCLFALPDLPRPRARGRPVSTRVVSFWLIPAPSTLPQTSSLQAVPNTWIQKSSLRGVMAARDRPSSQGALGHIGGRRLGPYEVLQASHLHRGELNARDYLLLRAATAEAAAGLPPTPDAAELAAAARTLSPSAPGPEAPSGSAPAPAPAGWRPQTPAFSAPLTESDVSASGDEADGDGCSSPDASLSDASSDWQGSEDDAPLARRKAAAPTSHRSAPLKEEGASEQAFLLSIIAALQARAPPARVRSLTAAAAASPPAGTHPLLQTLRPPPLTSYRVPFRC